MQLKPEEISKVIRSQIKYYENAIRQDETGTVLMVGDGIARASGLSNCMAGELLEFEDGSYGMAQNLEENSVSVVLFGSGENISEGQLVKRTGKGVSDALSTRSASQSTAQARLRQQSTVRLKARHRASVREKVLISRCRPVLKRSIPWFRSEEVSES